MPYKVPTTVDQVRAYVTGGSNAQVAHRDTLMVQLTHSNLTQTNFGDIRVDKKWTVGELKDKLYRQCGTPAHSQQLYVRSTPGGPVLQELRDDNVTVGDARIRNGQVIHVVDTDPHSLSAGGNLEDTARVERYVMSDEDYDKRENTFKKYCEERRRNDPTWRPAAPDLHPMDVADEPPQVKVGDRVEVFPGARRGAVMFVGRDLDALPHGWWIGVAYDEPVGKNDGAVKGTRYFTADPNCGGFIRPSKLKVGDYPVVDDLDDEV